MEIVRANEYADIVVSPDFNSVIRSLLSGGHLRVAATQNTEGGVAPVEEQVPLVSPPEMEVQAPSVRNTVGEAAFVEERTPLVSPPVREVQAPAVRFGYWAVLRVCIQILGWFFFVLCWSFKHPYLSFLILLLLFTRQFLYGTLTLLCAGWFSVSSFIGAINDWIYREREIFSAFSYRMQYGIPEPEPIPPPFDYLLCSLTAVAICVFSVVVFYLRGIYSGYRREAGYRGFDAERMVDGSRFVSSPMPTFMSQVYVLIGSTWYKAGMGFQTKEGFITAAHVIEGASKVELRRGDKVVVVDVDVFEYLNIGDIVIVRNRIFTELNLTCGKLAASALEVGQSEMVMAHNENLLSLGPLKPSNDVGMVDYHGSTTSGFSGSPYYMANIIFGMHLGSGTVNQGIEAAYIAAHLAPRKEASSTGRYFYDLISKGAKHRFKRDPCNPDEIVVNVGGKYHYMDIDEYNKAMTARREEEFDVGEMMEGQQTNARRTGGRGKRAYTYLDMETAVPKEVASGNGQSPVSTGPAVASTSTGNESRNQAETVQIQSSPLSDPTASPTLESSETNTNTAALESILAQKSEASASTSDDFGSEGKRLKAKLVSQLASAHQLSSAIKSSEELLKNWLLGSLMQEPISKAGGSTGPSKKR